MTSVFFYIIVIITQYMQFYCQIWNILPHNSYQTFIVVHEMHGCIQPN